MEGESANPIPLLLKRGAYIEEEKRYERGGKTARSRLDLSGTGNDFNRSNEFLSDYPGDNHIIKDRFFCQHEMGRTDFLQLHTNVPGQIISSFCWEYVPIFIDRSTDHVNPCDTLSTAFKQ